MFGNTIGTQTAQTIVFLSTIGTILGLTTFFAAVRMKNWIISVFYQAGSWTINWWYNDTELGELSYGVYQRHGRLAQVGLATALPGMIVIPIMIATPQMLYKMLVLGVRNPAPPVETLTLGVDMFLIGMAMYVIGVSRSYYRTFGSISGVLNALNQKNSWEELGEVFVDDDIEENDSEDTSE